MMPFSTSFRSLSIFLPIHAHMYLTHTTHIYMAFPIKLPECDNIILRVSAYRKLPYYKILIYLLIFFSRCYSERKKNDSFGGSCQKMFWIEIRWPVTVCMREQIFILSHTQRSLSGMNLAPFLFITLFGLFIRLCALFL